MPTTWEFITAGRASVRIFKPHSKEGSYITHSFTYIRLYWWVSWKYFSYLTMLHYSETNVMKLLILCVNLNTIRYLLCKIFTCQATPTIHRKLFLLPFQKFIFDKMTIRRQINELCTDPDYFIVETKQIGNLPFIMYYGV